VGYDASRCFILRVQKRDAINIKAAEAWSKEDAVLYSLLTSL
jgi:hypothetical protein